METRSCAFPGESAAYRTARNNLLVAERQLRRQIETVAEMRRSLPSGGALKADYRFQEAAAGGKAREVRFSDLFAPGRNTLVIYGFMFLSEVKPCPMCTAFLDSFDGAAPHIMQRVNLAVVAKATPQELGDWAGRRGWRHLRMLSSGECTYNADYLAEGADGSQWPMVNVFRRTDKGIHHTWRNRAERLLSLSCG